MKYLFFGSMLVFGCAPNPAVSSKIEGPGYQVDTLFTHEGCTVYRFRDGGQRYFTNCHGSTQWTEGHGKVVYDESVNGQ
jgi:hypothetical protein